MMVAAMGMVNRMVGASLGQVVGMKHRVRLLMILFPCLALSLQMQMQSQKLHMCGAVM